MSPTRCRAVPGHGAGGDLRASVLTDPAPIHPDRPFLGVSGHVIPQVEGLVRHVIPHPAVT
ncbi:hypothetical protein RHRU231_230008 [Rhodococcus ruber]|uniref:Uncharacterized protein n=1 Tax=Rhodococcus ruber TaxID=1830 RepID=A0A098BG33_9NOCA|nr:hypothetical protein RHRU231_230008 [Rhodococcus ruber]